MPIKWINRPGAAPAPPEKSNLLRTILAGGTRIGAGWLSSIPAMVPGIGSALGAGIAGLGEGAAEEIEGSELSPSRMAVEAALGAVPLGAIFKAGRPIQTAIRSAALAGVGEGGRELARGDDLDATGIATATGLGGLLGGILGRFPATHTAEEVPTEMYQMESSGGRPSGSIIRTAVGGKGTEETRVPGPWRGRSETPNLQTGGMLTREEFSAALRKQGNSPYGPQLPDAYRPAAKAAQKAEDRLPVDISKAEEQAYKMRATDERQAASAQQGWNDSEAKRTGAFENDLTRLLNRKIDQLPLGSRKGVEDLDRGIQQAGQVGSKLRAQVIKEAATGEREAARAQGAWNESESNRLQAGSQQEANTERIREAKVGREAQEPSVSDSLSAKNPDGSTSRMSIRYVTPKEEEDITDDVLNATEGLPEGKQVASEGGQLDKLRKIFKPTSNRPGYQELPPEGSLPDKIANAWIQIGRDAKRAYKLAAKGIAPREFDLVASEGESLATAPTVKQVLDEAPAPAAAVPEVASQASLEEMLKPAGRGKAARAPREPKALSYREQQQAESLAALEAKLKGESAPPPVASATSELTGGLRDSIDTLKAQIGDETPSNLLTNVSQKGRRENMPSLTGGVSVGEQVPPEVGTAGEAVPFYKSKVDASGDHYRQLQGLLKDGNLEGENIAALRESRGVAGQALRREAKEAGLPTGKAAKEAAATQAPLEAPQAQPQAVPDHVAQQVEAATAQPDWVQEEMRTVDELSALQRKLNGEGGAASPEMLMHLGLAGVGALAGGAIGGAAGHPLLGAALGAVGGAMSPMAAKSLFHTLGAPPELVDEALSKATTINGKDGQVILDPSRVGEFTKEVYHALPQVQRFNLLTSPLGLTANALVGPYGSAVMGAIEHALSGDPRGLEALKLLSPNKFMKGWLAARTEAVERILNATDAGRSEILPIGEGLTKMLQGATGMNIKATSPFELPGIAMTAGDISARNILMEAGFSETEARRITMTGEPGTKVFHSIANFGKGSTAAQLLFPFKRTPANIGEQGMQRLPLLGFMAQAAQETPDPLKQQLVQQGLGLGAGAAGYVAGENLDPTNSTNARRFLTNAAGQYSLPASLGMILGQANRAGKVPPAASIANDITPLPTTRPLQDLIELLTKGKVPSGALPAFVRELQPK